MEAYILEIRESLLLTLNIMIRNTLIKQQRQDDSTPKRVVTSRDRDKVSLGYDFQLDKD